ncbi:MAG: macro domain-containing protein [Fimbriimonadales bacterium]|nr:macro domain-containing protein [Fimbriimonadales bacterium]
MHQHPWLTRMTPIARCEIGGVTVELYGFAHTSLHRLPADVLILASDQTLRMVTGVRKQVRDLAAFNLVEEEAVRQAPLPPQGVAVTSGGRTRFQKILHVNIFDEQTTTNAALQREALRAALEKAAELNASTVAIADYTPDLRRAVAEETAWTVAEVIAHHRPETIRRVRLLCFEPTNAWAYRQILGWIAESGFEPYPYMLRVRHTVLHVEEAPPVGWLRKKPGWLLIPAEGLWHFTDPQLDPIGRFMRGAEFVPISAPGEPLVRFGGRALERAMREIAPIRLGEATYTPGGNLPIRWVVHLAIHDEQTPVQAETLRQATHAALELAHQQVMRTLLLPAPSWEDGLDRETFAQVIMDTISDYLHGENAFIERLILYGASDDETRPWQHAVDQLRERLTLPPLEAVEGEPVGASEA